MKTIAIFQGYYLPHTGGVERYTYNLSKKLNKQGFKIIIVTSKYNSELNEVEELEYATLYRLPIYKIFSNRYPIIKKNKVYRNILTELTKENIDYIILNTRFQLTTLVGAKFAKKYKIPCCVIEHGTSHFTVYNKILDCFGHRYEHILTSRVKSLVKDYYGVSNACINWLKHFKIEANGVFYNAIDDDEYNIYKDQIYIEENDKIKILFAGRLLIDKGLLLLIEAYNELIKKYSNIELIVAGDGPLKDKIISNEKINYVGELKHEEVMKLYNQADIFINPSYSEGLPTSVLEAGIMKCAIIATPVGGTIEIIEDKISGLFCDTTVQSIIEKLEILINDSELRNTLGDNIHKKIIEQFTWTRTAESIVKKLKL